MLISGIQFVFITINIARGRGRTEEVCFHSIPKLFFKHYISEACLCAQFQQVSHDVLTRVVAPDWLRG